ncbi:patatin-like phospholipase family protein [Okeanomitos corallinicola TIOX110]|uniref:Patatin-like phospholipase family protein n=1 Tax=Okeanomitos corallinicola TIOX110 TaxID=3133117 RepID=A0ABZ2USW8_9CYAN
MSIYEKADKKTGPYKLLALDGGGIRGMMTLEVLAEIEATLRNSLGADENFVLADYFDYVAGTSTGAIIATAISLGMSVADIQKFYRQSGERMFDKAFILSITGTLVYKYGDKNLANQLKKVFGEDTTFGSKDLKTLLMLVMRNVNTDSPWPLSNNPYAKYNNPENVDSNLKLPLWQLVRASTAAPTFFPPEQVQLGDNKFIFVDGGVTPYNNPAFQLFLMATAQPYQLKWSASEDNMLLVSVGTGLTPKIDPNLKASQMHTIYNAQNIPGALMLASQNEQDFLCRIFGKCLSGDPIDGEVGDLIGAKGPLESKLFTYLRYDVELTRQGLDKLGGLDDINVENVQQMDSIKYMTELERIGKAIAKKVQPEHFANFV